MARIAGPLATEVPPLLLPPPGHLSWSQVAKLVGAYRYSCPRQWAYQYRLGLPTAGSAAMCAGSVYDEGVSAWHFVRMQGGTHEEALATAGRAASARWEDSMPSLPEPLDSERSALYVEAISKGLAVYVDAYWDVRAAAVQMRHEFTVRALDGQRVRTVVGFSDVIRDDGVIEDNKWSGSPRWDSAGVWDADWVAEKRDQLAMYWLARCAEERRGMTLTAPVVPRGRLVVMYMNVRMRTPQLRTLDLEFGAEEEARVIDRIREGDRVAAEGRYPARPGDACGFCSFVDLCRSHQRQAEPSFSTLTGIPEAI